MMGLYDHALTAGGALGSFRTRPDRLVVAAKKRESPE